MNSDRTNLGKASYEIIFNKVFIVQIISNIKISTYENLVTHIKQHLKNLGGDASRRKFLLLLNITETFKLGIVL